MQTWALDAFSRISRPYTMRRQAVLIATLMALLLAACALGMLFGQGSLADAALRPTFLKLRAYRVAVAFFAGASLSVGGVVVQGLFRNPLASPEILGTTAGASFGGQAALIVLGLIAGRHLPDWLAPEMVLPAGCLLGALVSLGILLLITHFTDDLLVVLLTGFLLSSLFLSIGSFLTTVAQGYWELGRAVVAFTLGGVGGSGLRQVLLIAPLALAGAIAAWCWAKPLDLLLTGEEEAQSLGVDVTEVRRWSVIWVALLTAAAVSVGGNVGFVGLIVPHVLRPFTGATHKRLVPAAAIFGGTFLILCDLLTRIVPGRGEIPLGVITGLIGAPLFLFLLIRTRWAPSNE